LKGAASEEAGGETIARYEGAATTGKKRAYPPLIWGGLKQKGQNAKEEGMKRSVNPDRKEVQYTLGKEAAALFCSKKKACERKGRRKSEERSRASRGEMSVDEK